jgi:tetratricopeptide (TPR) repeat protein
MSRRLTFILCLLAVAAGGRAQTETTLFAPVPLAPTPAAAGEFMLDEESARRALALGFSATAAAQAEKLLEVAPPGSAGRDAAALLLATARLDLGDLRGAERALAAHSDTRPPAYRLRAGLLAARQGRIPAAQAEAAALRAEDLPAEERSWVYFLQGMVAETSSDPARAGAAYDQALAAAASEWQRARLRLARERLRLAQGEVTENQANALREQAERYSGRSLSADFAAQHAVALELLGRREAAVAYLQAQLNTLPDGLAAARDDLRLVLGLIAGPGQGAGRAALEQLLAAGGDPGEQRIALQLLVQATETGEARQRLRRTLDDLLAALPPHALTEDLLVARAELALATQDYERAEADARDLLTRFPASEQRPRALMQLAATAWDRRRFRTAGDFAAQAAEAAIEPATRAALRLLAAEAAYRAAQDAKRGGAPVERDFLVAAEAYAAATDSPPPGVPVAAVIFQEIMARIEAGRLAEAVATIDRRAADPRFDATTRWQAEWNLARALQAGGERELALARVGRLRAETEAAERPAGLRARLAWLEARLAQESGRSEEALRLARAVPESLAGVEEALAREITGLARLVEAEALFGLGRGEEAMGVLRGLRAAEGGTEAAVQSFLVEADYLAAMGRLVEAQGLLVDFADKNRDHEYAPDAIFQAALNAERRGEDVYLREAYVLLEEQLVRRYPRSRLYFSARLKQGDLLRRLGDFAAAQQIYDDLVNNQAQHPRILEAQMALADSHRAQAARDPSHFESALTILERLRDLVDAPAALRAEAGFKLGDMLAQRDSQAALAAWWPVVDALLLEPRRAAGLGAEGRYWIGRLLVRHAGVLEQAGRAEEAREAWRLVTERGLPGAALARARLAAGAAVAAP